MKKILFLHGFFATGSCPMANAMREAFEGAAVVLTPDLPLHPKEALKEIRSIIDKEHPDLLVGNSCGAFIARLSMVNKHIGYVLKRCSSGKLRGMAELLIVSQK